MEITQQIRREAAQGMADKSDEFRKQGEIYVASRT
jgi:hypothetical protein